MYIKICNNVSDKIIRNETSAKFHIIQKKEVTWYIPIPRVLGSSFDSSSKGSCNRLPMDTENNKKWVLVIVVN